MKSHHKIIFLVFLLAGFLSSASAASHVRFLTKNNSKNQAAATNPFFHHLGHYQILSAEQCIQNDYPAYCPWEKVEVFTDKMITCLKFTVESSLQHYCFEAKRTEDESSEYSHSPPATWTSRKRASSGEHWVYQVVFEIKNMNPVLKIEEYSWANSTSESPVRIDKKIHLQLKAIMNP